MHLIRAWRLTRSGMLANPTTGKSRRTCARAQVAVRFYAKFAHFSLSLSILPIMASRCHLKHAPVHLAKLASIASRDEGGQQGVKDKGSHPSPPTSTHPPRLTTNLVAVCGDSLASLMSLLLSLVGLDGHGAAVM